MPVDKQMYSNTEIYLPHAYCVVRKLSSNDKCNHIIKEYLAYRGCANGYVSEEQLINTLGDECARTFMRQISQ